jgi:N-acylneuraminate cytidylyltransferase
MGIGLLMDENIHVMVMTSENSEIVAQRMKKLQIEDVFLGVKDKYSFLEEVLKMKGIRRSEIAYMGDDINDLSNILSCGLGICPKDATDEIKESADIILTRNGGDKAVREACDFILKINKRQL